MSALTTGLKYEDFKNPITGLEVEYKPSTTFTTEGSNGTPKINHGIPVLLIKSPYGSIQISTLNTLSAFKAGLLALSDTANWPQSSGLVDEPLYKYIIDDKGDATIGFYSKTSTGTPDQVRLKLPGGSMQGPRDEVLSALSHSKITTYLASIEAELEAMALSN